MSRDVSTSSRAPWARPSAARLGGFTAGRKEIVELLRQRSRTYLFSNTLAPPMVMASIRALEMVREDPSLRGTLWANTGYFRDKMSSLGFTILPGEHPIVPIMLGDELKTVELAKAVNDQGIFVVGFSFPVVPRGEARDQGPGDRGPHPRPAGQGRDSVRAGRPPGRRYLGPRCLRTAVPGRIMKYGVCRGAKPLCPGV